MQRRPPRLIRLARSRRAGCMMPWVTAIVLLVFPIAIADFDYRYLLPVLPFARLASGLAFAPARAAATPDVPARLEQDQLTADFPGPARPASQTASPPGLLARLLPRPGLDKSMASDRITRVFHGRRFGQLLRSGGVRRILSAGESAGRSRRAQAR